jgi:hypothetical protein
VARNVEQLEGKAPTETEIEIPAENTDNENENNVTGAIA